MKKDTKGLNDRDLEILDILGFDSKTDLTSFLEKTLKTADVSELHSRGIALRSVRMILKIELRNRGIALRSVRMILKKIKPYHKIFIKNNNNDGFYEDDANFSSAESVVCFLNSAFSVSTTQEVPASHCW